MSEEEASAHVPLNMLAQLRTKARHALTEAGPKREAREMVDKAEGLDRSATACGLVCLIAAAPFIKNDPPLHVLFANTGTIVLTHPGWPSAMLFFVGPWEQARAAHVFLGHIDEDDGTALYRVLDTDGEVEDVTHEQPWHRDHR